MAKNSKSEIPVSKDNFNEEPTFGESHELDTPVEAQQEMQDLEQQEGQEKSGTPANYDRVYNYLKDNPEFHKSAMDLAANPDAMKRAIVAQDIIKERQFEARYNSVWAKLSAQPKLLEYYNSNNKSIKDPSDRRKAICKEYYESMKIERNYIEPRFYDKNVTETQIDAKFATDPKLSDRLNKIQSEGKLLEVYARGEMYITSSYRAKKRAALSFLNAKDSKDNYINAPDREQLLDIPANERKTNTKTWTDEQLAKSVINDLYFRTARKDSSNEKISAWLDKNPQLNKQLEEKHAGKEEHHKQASILKDAAIKYKQATGANAKGANVEMDQASIDAHMAKRPEVYAEVLNAVKNGDREFLVIQDVARRKNGMARSWKANPELSRFTDLIKEKNPRLFEQIRRNVQNNTEPFKTQKFTEQVAIKGKETEILESAKGGFKARR